SSTQLKRQKFDCGLDDAVEGNGNSLGLPLSCHRQEGSYDPGATLGCRLDSLGSADQGRILGHLLKKDDLPDHHRQRIVQLVSNACQKRSQHCHLLVLEQNLALADDFLLNSLMFGDVTDRSDEATRLGLIIENETSNQEPALVARCTKATDLNSELAPLVG